METTDGLPRWYLDASGPRLKRLDELSPIAYPDGEAPDGPEAREAMHLARQEWKALIAAQMADEVLAGL